MAGRGAAGRQWRTMSPPAAPLPAEQAWIMLDARDNVAIAARTLRQGERLGEVVVRGDVPKGHKIAVAPIARGALVRKYAQMIGHAKRAIKAGEHVHVHNLAFRQSRPDYRIGKDARRTKMTPAKKRATFMGYRRPGGRVGTRNYVAVISSVNCSATASRMIAGRFSRARLARQHPNVDGVVAFVHGSGCGMAPDGEGIANLRRVMRGYAAHPNVAAVLLVGLGCEDNQLGEFLATQGLRPGRTLRMLTIQGAGGLRRAVASGVAAVEELLAEADKCKRSACSAADLRVALQCGGSDAWSGVTANPALGHAVDLLVAQGGSAVIAETPEVYGAEHLLTCRAESPAVARALIARLRWWEDYTARNGGSMDNNPSPGNKLGGLTTILEKSLGAVAKGGTTAFREFVPYASPPRRRGFVMMDSPGYDPVSVTGQIAAGCNLVAFTTGRGSAFGSKPAPTLKICTNSETYRRMREDMDVDAGAVVAAGRPLPQVGEEIFARLLALASGERSKSERQGLGDLEFVPWQIGATM